MLVLCVVVCRCATMCWKVLFGICCVSVLVCCVFFVMCEVLSPVRPVLRVLCV